MTFEWSGAATRTGWVWMALLGLVAAPFPLWFVAPHVPAGFPVIERGVPIFFLLLAAGVLVLGRIASVSWPFAALLLWATLRGAWHGVPPRTLQLLTLGLFAGLLYAAARHEVSDRWARWAVWGLTAGVLYEVGLGWLNTMGFYPWMSWVAAEHVGKPMGLLTHPNYWGSIVALGLPIVWATLGAPVAALLFVLIGRTISGGPVISASVGILVLLWPMIGRRVRYAVVGLAGAAVAVVMTLHEWRLSGRREVWEVALTEMRKWPITGQGLGEWRTWAEQYNGLYYRPDQGQHFFITLQAHNEPLQLAFELGLVGLVLGGLWALQAWMAARTVWRAAPVLFVPAPTCRFGWLMSYRVPLERAWIAVLVVAGVNMLGSPVFHLPAQAACILFAAARLQADAAALSVPHRRSAPAKRPRARKESLYVADPS